MNFAEPASYVDEYLRLEALASEPYSAFVYESAQEARTIARFCFDAGVGECVPPHGRVVIGEDGAVLGVIAFLDGADLKTARTSAAMCLLRGAKIDPDGPVRERMWLASETLLDVDPDDLYLSRIAVAEASRGRGIASWLMNAYEQSARAAAKRRLVLEVSPRHVDAIALYSRCGFELTRAVEAYDPSSHRTLSYRHMVKPIG
ncbi:MAG TPA: GNAT family N-acetyltransferase [Kofleriaceae bacterium]|jgi:ribosomal protein S18 acetylase RimI-like enzyme